MRPEPGELPVRVAASNDRRAATRADACHRGRPETRGCESWPAPRPRSPDPSTPKSGTSPLAVSTCADSWRPCLGPGGVSPGTAPLPCAFRPRHTTGSKGTRALSEHVDLKPLGRQMPATLTYDSRETGCSFASKPRRDCVSVGASGTAVAALAKRDVPAAFRYVEPEGQRSGGSHVKGSPACTQSFVPIRGRERRSCSTFSGSGRRT